jgi:predicted dehydrogenase/nucleoside-diphosphate-sugar epimerase
MAPRERKRRTAIVGAGYIARVHAEILAAMRGVELVAVCDVDPQRARDLAARFAVPAAVCSVEDLVRLDVDAAHVLTPPDTHAEVVRELLRLKVDVFVEKPPALSSRETRELDRFARSQGARLAVNHNSTHHPAFARARELARRGSVGRVRHVQVTLHAPVRQLESGRSAHWMFRAAPNVVFDLGYHALAQLHDLIGRVVEARTTVRDTIQLSSGQRFHAGWAGAARAELGSASFDFAFGATFARSTLCIHGTDGVIDVDLLRDHVSLETRSRWIEPLDDFLSSWRRAAQLGTQATLRLAERRDGFHEGMRRSIHSFYEPPGATAEPECAARVLEWCEAVTAETERRAALEVTADGSSPPRPGEVVVLGASGFIGERTVAKLIEAGQPVTAVVREPRAVSRALASLVGDGKARLLAARLEDEPSLAEALRGATSVVHLATGGGDRWEEIERGMVRGTARVAKICLDERARRLIYVSSIAALYLGPDCGRRTIDDDTPRDPQPERRAIYARGKIVAEAHLERLHREHGLPVVIARPGVVLGPGAPPRHSALGLWVNDGHCILWGWGRHRLPLVYVDDVAAALVRLVAYDGADLNGRALNLCACPPLSARELLREVNLAAGRRIRFHPRPLWLLHAADILRWTAKKIARREAAFPSWRDLKSRTLAPRFEANLARERLGWKPVEERERFLDLCVRGGSDSKTPR